jgi:dCTP diphosphatase
VAGEAWEDLQLRLERFRDDRDWRQFHTLKDLAAAITIEASELQQLFLWARADDESNLLKTSRDAIESELADVVIQALNFAAIADVDLPGAISRKIDENERRYPADAVRGSSKKATRE